VGFGYLANDPEAPDMELDHIPLGILGRPLGLGLCPIDIADPPAVGIHPWAIPVVQKGEFIFGG
jgi:hypothetical protein